MKENKRRRAKQSGLRQKKDTQAELARLLAPYRVRIDRLDDRIMSLLDKRFSVIRTVAGIKAKAGIPAFLPDRVIEVRERAAVAAKKYGINESFARTLYTILIYQSCIEEEEVQHAARPARKRRNV